MNRAVAATGICSRRQADHLIAQGLVRVNGSIITDFNHLVDPVSDSLAVQGQKLAWAPLQYLLFYKPKGVITTLRDERKRLTVIDLLPGHLSHLKPVGRLDRDSEGLLLLTNDGNLAQTLSHPSHKVWKKYLVTVAGNVSSQCLGALGKSIKLDGQNTIPAKVRLLEKDDVVTYLEISICEGKNRQIRRLCGQMGLRVLSLVRVAIGELKLNGLKPGKFRRLNSTEIQWLKLMEHEARP